MKLRRYRTWVKVLAVVLLAVSLLMACLSGFATIYNMGNGYFGVKEEALWEDTIRQLTYERNGMAVQAYCYNAECEEIAPESNYRYRIYRVNSWNVTENSTRTDVGGTYNGEASQYQYESVHEEFVWDEDTQSGNPRYYLVEGYVLTELTGDDDYAAARKMLSVWYAARYPMVAVLIVSVLMILGLYGYLLCAAGHKDGDVEVTLGKFWDQIPFDAFTGVMLLAAVYGYVFLFEVWWRRVNYIGEIVLMVIALCGMSAILLIYSMSTAVRVKLHVLLKKTLCWRLLQAFRWGVLWLIRFIPLVWQVAAAVVIITIAEFIGITVGYYAGNILVLWILEKLILIPLILWVVWMMHGLQKTAKSLVEGDLEAKAETKWMAGPFKVHAERLNSIQEGIHIAVKERMKSEHFKTELITNVSHDIKTPLTSIINYVDLIKKEDPQDETLREYVGVLDRQSVRLKKLIEDLVEASKASTGNLTVQMTRCEVGVLLGQAVGEYEEKLQTRQLEVKLSIPEEPVTILADGRHLWRVFDNLLNNICKYSLPLSRVYLSLEKIEGMAAITFRNISQEALNISSEALMERFVRGDGSRHTEGSGLGLSIARSLVELQQGTIELVVDGDLFKVVLRFRTVEQQ